MNLSWLNPDSIIQIIETASQLVLNIYISTDFAVVIKDDNSPVTIADKKANDYICQNLRMLYPDIPIISEESKNEPYHIRKNYTYAWLIDPLDGTKEFIKKNGEFTVNIGLIYKQTPIAGFVNIPAQGLTYWAVQGMGAFIKNIDSPHNQDLREIRNINASFSSSSFSKISSIVNKESSTNKTPKSPSIHPLNSTIPSRRTLRVLASRSHSNPETEEFISKLGEVELLNVGSSIKILWVAENKADIYPRLQGSMEWDTCAAHAILKVLDGTMQIYKDNELHEEIFYNKEDLTNPHFVCAFFPFFFKRR